MGDRQRRLRAIDDEVVQRVAAVPGVAAVAVTGDDPFGPPYRYGERLQIGDTATPGIADSRIASPTARDALGLHMIAGRWFTAADREGMPVVAVVNQAMARRFWPNRNPVGDRMLAGKRDLQIVGIVADVYGLGARRDVTPTFYVSSTQTSLDREAVMLVVRPRAGAARVETLIGAALAPMAGRVKAGRPRRLADLWWSQLADARFLTFVVSVFSIVALVVALVGVHGVLRFLVAQRSRELGIRQALGATRASLIALVLGQVFRFAAAGCVAGLIAAAAAAPAIRSLLFGITPADPLTLVTAAVLLMTAVLCGAYFPARRASAADPVRPLRSE